MAMIIEARCVVPGWCRGELIATSESISFWGGVDPCSGEICDPRHELFRQSIAGKILVFPKGKGSSTGSLIVLELARVGKAPAAIVNVTTEPILATGPIVCRHFYQKEIAIVNVEPEALVHLKTGLQATVDAGNEQIVVEL